MLMSKNKYILSIFMVGGSVTVAKKCKGAQQVETHSPFVITTNTLPDFGKDTRNVHRRLAIFKMKPLPVQVEGVIDI